MFGCVMSYREPLPENCPPSEAEEITTARVAFRLVRTTPATLDDFRSQRAEKPEAVFHVTECQAREQQSHGPEFEACMATKGWTRPQR